MSELDPQCAEVLRRVAAWGASERPSVTEWRELEQRRFAEFAAAPEPVKEIRDLIVPAPTGPVPVRIYQPVGDCIGTFVWLHGGGWVLGSPDLCDDQVRAIANASSCAVLSVDYRLAPEHPFPAGLDDSLAVVRWAAVGGAGGRGGALVVGGESAGGNLAAAVTLLARDAGEPVIDLQVLVHPALDRDADSSSKQQFAHGYGLTASAMDAFWDQYAGAERGPLVSPLRAATLAGLPPALVVTAECDILRDEGERYANELRAAGVPVTLRRCEGMMHGFLAHAGVIDAARAAFGWIGDGIQRQIKESVG